MPLNKWTLQISSLRLTRALGLSAAFFSLAFCSLNGAANRTPEIRVILWFDTEDYLSPRDDDATKRLCDMLSDRGIRATFKIVGEKADRKSTRLNSSHVRISYAVFCLKKKKT